MRSASFRAVNGAVESMVPMPAAPIHDHYARACVRIFVLLGENGQLRHVTHLKTDTSSARTLILPLEIQ